MDKRIEFEQTASDRLFFFFLNLLPFQQSFLFSLSDVLFKSVSCSSDPMKCIQICSSFQVSDEIDNIPSTNISTTFDKFSVSLSLMNITLEAWMPSLSPTALKCGIRSTRRMNVSTNSFRSISLRVWSFICQEAAR